MSSLITIDWDYFMNYMSHWNGSYIENDNNINKHWYKKYYEEKKSSYCNKASYDTN